jgi:type IV secretion system protein VirB8
VKNMTESEGLIHKLFDKLAAVPDPQQDTYYQAASSWYIEVYESLQCSRDRYRALAIALVMLTMLCIGSMAAMLPLKTSIYRILEVNTQTGEISQLTQLESTKLTEKWVVTRYFINQYVRERHEYHFEDIKRSFNDVLSMSQPDISSSYSQDIIDTNPKSPINVLGKDSYRDVVVLGQNQLNANTALVRFRTLTHSKANPADVKTDDYQVVIKWQYRNSQATLSERDTNPLGFTVTYYQVSPLYNNT